MKSILFLQFLALSMAVGAGGQPPNWSPYPDMAHLPGFDPSDFGPCSKLDDEATRRRKTDALPVLNIALGDPLRGSLENHLQYFTPFKSSDRVAITGSFLHISVKVEQERIERSVGGMDNVAVQIDATPMEGRIYAFEFYDQQCPITIADALERVARIEAQIRAAGFKTDSRIIFESVERGGGISDVTGWQSSLAILTAAPRKAYDGVMVWKRGTQEVLVSIHNWGANAPTTEFEKRYGARSVFELDGTGRKYGVSFSLSDMSMIEADYRDSTSVESDRSRN